MTPGSSADGANLLYGAPASRVNSVTLSVDERHELAGGTVTRDPTGLVSRFMGDAGHCDFGPALEFPSGRKLHMRHGVLHREDGPAAEGGEDFPEAWYLEGIRVAPPAPGEPPALPEPLDVEVDPMRGKHEKRRTRLLLKVPVLMEATDFDTAKHTLANLEECGHVAAIVCVDEAGNETVIDATSIKKGRVPMDAVSYHAYTAEKLPRRKQSS